MVDISRENLNTRQNRSINGLIPSDCCFCFATPSCMDESDLKSSLLNLFWATEDGKNDNKEEEYIGPLYERGNGHGNRREGGQGQRRSSTSSRPPAIPNYPNAGHSTTKGNHMDTDAATTPSAAMASYPNTPLLRRRSSPWAGAASAPHLTRRHLLPSLTQKYTVKYNKEGKIKWVCVRD